MKRRSSEFRYDPTQKTAPGYTLVELLVGMTASSLLLVGLAAAIGVTAKAITPSETGERILQAAKTTSLLADELQSAVHLRDVTSHSIDFLVNNRDPNNSFDDIQYQWTAGSQNLARSFRQQTGTLLNDVTDFNIRPIYHDVSEDLGGRLEESEDATLAQVTSASGWDVWYLSPWDRIGHSVDMSHPSNTVYWQVTSARVLIRRDYSYNSNEQIIVQLREATGDGNPTSNVLAEATVPVSSLSSWSWQWKTVSFNMTRRLLPSENVCLVISGDDSNGGYSGQVAYARWGFSDDGCLLKENYGYWNQDHDDALFYRITGTRGLIDDTSHLVTRKYFVACNVTMSHEGGASLWRKIRLLNSPEKLSGQWTLNFNEDPAAATIDTNVDSLPDWSYIGSGSSSVFANRSLATLSSGQQFESTADYDFDGLITAEVHARGLTHNSAGGGARLEIPFGFDSSNQGLVTVRIDRTSSGAQTATVTAASGESSEMILAMAENLSDAIVNVRVVIDADSDVAAVWINDQTHGRTDVTRPLSGVNGRVRFGAEGADAEYDFLSVRIGVPKS